jgi:lysophospholipase L1-like esterase
MNNTRVSAVVAGLLLTASAAFAVDFSNYVAMGDSLTAGWQSGCLVDRHQLKSYPAVLAGQFGTTVAQVGDDNLAHFQQPLVSEPGIPQPCSTLTFDPSTGAIGIDQHLGEAPGHPENALLPRPYNNLGIPGAHSYDMLDVVHSTGTDIFSLDGTNAVEQAIAQSPTFLTVFVGNNDTLDAAGTATVDSASCLALNPAGGGSCEGVTFTSVDVFTAKYTEMVQTLHAALPSTTLLLFNLPNVTSIPFATTVPPVVIDPHTNQPVINPQTGGVIPLIGQAHDGSVGPIPLNTLVTLPALALEAQGLGIPCAVAPNLPLCDHPLPDGGLAQDGLHPGVLLYADEVATLLQQVATFNGVIASAAAAVGAHVMDANALFADVAAHGRTYGGVTLTTSFLTGGLFSYDGVHPSNIGYAAFADEVVKFINATYGTDVPRVDVYAALFQPDVAPASGAAPQGRGASHRAGSLYPLQTWQTLLDTFRPTDPSFHLVPAAALFGSPGQSAPRLHR